MALKLEDYMKHYPFLKFSQADIDMGRENFGALEGIINAKVERHHATTKEAKDATNLDFMQRVDRAKGNAVLSDILAGGSGRSGGGCKKSR